MCGPLVKIGICQPSQDLDLKPLWFNLPAIKEHATCSPDDTNTSYSESMKLLLICFDFLIKSFVTPLIAEETTIKNDNNLVSSDTNKEDITLEEDINSIENDEEILEIDDETDIQDSNLDTELSIENDDEMQQLDLARAYIEMGALEDANKILDELQESSSSKRILDDIKVLQSKLEL